MYYQYIYLSYFIILWCFLHNSPPLLFSLIHSSLHPAPSFAFILLPPLHSAPFLLSCFLPSILLRSPILLPSLHSAPFLYPASSPPFCSLPLSCFLPFILLPSSILLPSLHSATFLYPALPLTAECNDLLSICPTSPPPPPLIYCSVQ